MLRVGPRICHSLPRPRLLFKVRFPPTASHWQLDPTRWLFTTAVRHEKNPQASQPDREVAREPTSGQPVSDYAKEDETKRSGGPGAEDHVPAPKHLASLSTPNLFSLANRTIIVTGGGRGLGLTVAHSLLESGASVAALDLLPEPTQPAWDESLSFAKSEGLNLTYHALDVTDVKQVTDIFSNLFSLTPRNQPVRGLFCAAGIQLLMPALDYTPEQFRTVIDVNLTGSFLCAQAFSREFDKRRSGPGIGGESEPAGQGVASIVMTGSMSGTIANFGLECTAYNASKAGVIQMGKNMAMEWGKKGIRVNTLSPGYIRTALTAALLAQRPDFNEVWLRDSLLGRLSTPDEYRGPVVFLLSDASSYMTGADLIIDGGHTAT